MTIDLNKMLQPGGIVPIDIPTTAALVAEVQRLREALITAKWMLERDQIDKQKLAVIDKCNDALKETP